MKVEILENDCFQIYMNELLIKNIDFKVEKDVEKLLRNIILHLNNKFGIILSGLYETDIFINKKNGIYVALNKVDSFLLNKNIDFKVNIINNYTFFYKTKDYFAIDKLKNIYFYDNEFYVDCEEIDDIYKYIEYGDIVCLNDINLQAEGIKIK